MARSSQTMKESWRAAAGRSPSGPSDPAAEVRDAAEERVADAREAAAERAAEVKDAVEGTARRVTRRSSSKSDQAEGEPEAQS